MTVYNFFYTSGSDMTYMIVVMNVLGSIELESSHFESRKSQKNHSS